MMDWQAVVGFTILFHAVVYATTKSWILRLDTKKLNKCINGISTNRIRKYFRAWFRLGSYITIWIGFPFTIWLFLRTIFHTLLPSVATIALAVTPATFLASTGVQEPLELHREELSPYPDAEIPVEPSSGSGSDSSYLAIQPVLPGWNLPLSHLPYYLVAILISVVIHELGHAVSSASHRIPILSMGVSLFGPLIPAAHVELNSTQLREAPIKKQLDILTAGVWMNIYLSLIAYFVMPWLLPVVLFPTHGVGQGVAVTGIIPNSGAGGRGGLERGDVITGVENCPVKDLDSWLTCLEAIWEEDPVGHCLDDQTVEKYLNYSENSGCCGADKDNSPTHLCFLQTAAVTTETLKPKQNFDLEPDTEAFSTNHTHTFTTSPRDLVISNTSNNSSSHCLPAKPIVMLNSTSAPKCYAPQYECPTAAAPASQTGDESLIPPPVPSQCYLAQLLHQYKSFRIIQIHRRQSSPKESVLFVGDVWDLRNGVDSTDYAPRSWWLTQVLSFSLMVKVPVHLETVLLLTAGLSAGLAVVNMLPIYGLDGYHVADAVVRSALGKRWEPRKISRLVNYISWTAITMAMVTVVCSLVQNF